MIHFAKLNGKCKMQLDKVSVNETLNKAESLLKEEQGLSPAIRAIIEILNKRQQKNYLVTFRFKWIMVLFLFS
jgi:hypothetical protein